MVRIKLVTVEHHRETLGIGESNPRISWSFESQAQSWYQESYDIEIKCSGRTSSEVFHQVSSSSIFVPWPAEPLQSREKVTLRVRATGYQGSFERAKSSSEVVTSTEWSEYVVVETGLLSREDWTASLIAAPVSLAPSGAIRPPLFRKSFKLENNIRKSIEKARLYITAQGIYEANINGHRVGDHVLAPGWTSYNHHLNYQTFDVTKMLDGGENIITVEVGEGWFCTRLGFLGGKRCIYGARPAVLAQLEITRTNGAPNTIINSDGTWITGVGPRISSEIYDGEVYDANLRVKNLNAREFHDNSWSIVDKLDFPTCQLLSSKGPPVRKIESLRLKEVIQSPRGKTILDFGQNIVGWLKIHVQGSKGDVVNFTHTEVLDNKGECATGPLRDCKAQDIMILSGEALDWEPKFTFHGFRYVQVDGWPSGEPLEAIEAVVVHTDLELTGTFTCSNNDINKLHENIRWGMKGNFLSIPTDCPQRDERLGWTGDIQIFAPVASFLYNTAGMLAGWLQDLAVEQLIDNNGVPPLVCPNVIDGSLPKTQAAWADAVIILPYELYTAFGDPKILRNQHASMKTWIDIALPRNSSGLWDESFHQLGDWLDPSAPPAEPGKGKTDPQLVANAYLVRITNTMRKVSEVLDLDKDYTLYTMAYQLVKAAFQDEYMTKNGRLAPDTMTSLSLALSYDLIPHPLAKTAAKRLVQLVRASKFKIGTGFVGTPLILPVLAAAGYPQIAYRMLLEKKCPSWLYPITMGATTMWERWDSMMPDREINPGSMTSFNHYALGSVASFLHGTIGGISPQEPGWKVIRVAPIPGGEIKWARVRFESSYGTVSCEWTLECGNFLLKLCIPPNTRAEVILPGKSTSSEWVDNGNHEWCINFDEVEWPPNAISDPFALSEAD